MKNIKNASSQFWHWFKNHLPIIILLAVAGAFRYINLANLPGGLFPDEAANGLDINSILSGDLQPFYERGNGREALFFYLLTPAVLLFGRTPFAHHFVSASVGILVVLFTYLLMRRWFNEKIAFIAAFLAAVSSWYVTLSRTAFRANTTPLLLLLFFYFATRVVQSKSRKDYWLSSIFAGVSFGLGFYTYISYRMAVPLVGLVLLSLLIIDFRNNPRFQIIKKYGKAFVVFVISGLVSLVPLMLFFVKNPEWIAGRSGQVSIFSPDLNDGDVVGTFLTVVGKTAMGFITNGDVNWRHNVSGFPFLSFLVAPLFVVGLLLIVTQATLFFVNAFRKHQQSFNYQMNLKRLPYFIIALWFFFMLIPEILTAEGIPHGLRLVGVIPVVFIIPALFIGELITEMPHQLAEKKFFKRSLVNILITVFLLAEAFYGMYLYFGIAGNSSYYAAAFNTELTTVSNYLSERNQKEKTYLIIDPFYEQTVNYFTTEQNQPYKLIDVRNPYQLNLKTGDQVIFSLTSLWGIGDFQNNYPGLTKVIEKRNGWNEIEMLVYQK